MKEAGGRRGKTARNAERREGGVENRMGGGGGWGYPTESEELFWGSSELSGQREEDNFKGERNFFFSPHGNFTSGQKTLELPAEQVHLEGALPCHSPRMDFVSFNDVQT